MVEHGVTENKMKAEDSEVRDTDKDGDVNISQLIMMWVHEANSAVIEKEEEEVGAWDDVHGGGLPKEKVEAQSRMSLKTRRKANPKGYACTLRKVSAAWETHAIGFTSAD